MPATLTTGAERFATDAVDALLMRSGLRAASQSPSQAAQQLQHMPLAEMARRCLELGGRQVGAFVVDAESVALAALQMCGSEVRSIGSMDSSYARPGDFPNLLSNLAGKILDDAIEIAGATYPVWTARLPDLADFKPKTILGFATRDELDEILDDEEARPMQMAEEAAGWIQAGRYGNKVGLTPVMVANDDLDAFTQGLQSLEIAHETTLNRLCIALVAGNVTLLDGNALFDSTNHGNDVVNGLGGEPSTTQANKMRLLHRRQTGIGGFGKVRTPPRIALVPTSHEEAAMQTFLQFSQLAESKLAATDATINTFRGTITPVVEPDLEDYSLAYWYTFADPRIRRVIVHAFQRGFGKGGKRTSWFDPGKKTMYVDLEGRFAAAVCGHRGAVRNIGA
ncbi:MAG: phage major capsid protein [Pirellulaceae bacterium]